MSRILFFHQGAFSHINDAVAAGLRHEFPAHEVRTFDLDRLLKNRPWLVAANMVAAARTYGRDLFTGRRDLDDAFSATAYIFHRVRRLAARLHHRWPADFSIQTQSMFDCSVPGIPHFIYTDHTYEARKESFFYGRARWASVRPDWLIGLERSIYAHATSVFTMSGHVTATLLKHYGVPAEDALCVRAGCNASASALASIPINLDRYRTKRLLFVGREWDRKGGPDLLRALPIISCRHPGVTLTVLGCSPRVADPRVQVVGDLPLDSVAPHYARAAIFVLPTRLEPFGIAFLEAMAAGLPVIGPHLGAVPDFVIPGRTGLLVTPNDPASLAEAIIRLLNDPAECQFLAENAREFVRSEYSWDRALATMARRIRERVPMAPHPRPV